MPRLSRDNTSSPSPGGRQSIVDVCADCNTPGPSWASLNRGVLVCDDCAGVHAKLGRHISHIRSLRDGYWSETLMEMVRSLVNTGANSIWEHSLRKGSRFTSPRKPGAKDSQAMRKDFIHAKYKHLQFVAKQPARDDDTVEDYSRQLHASVRHNNLATCLRLLSLGAQVNFFSPERGNMAIHVAASAGQLLQCELLAIHGADTCALDCRGHTPVECARIAGYHELAERLIELQYEVTDRLTAFVCGERPVHILGEHHMLPDLPSELDSMNRDMEGVKRLRQLCNSRFEELAADLYDEVERRENEEVWNDLQGDVPVSFLPANSAFPVPRNQGRSKLAKLTQKDLSMLIVDLLKDAKRRQQDSLVEKGDQTGSLVPVDGFEVVEKSEGAARLGVCDNTAIINGNGKVPHTVITPTNQIPMSTLRHRFPGALVPGPRVMEPGGRGMRLDLPRAPVDHDYDEVSKNGEIHDGLSKKSSGRHHTPNKQKPSNGDDQTDFMLISPNRSNDLGVLSPMSDISGYSGSSLTLTSSMSTLNSPTKAADDLFEENRILHHHLALAKNQIVQLFSDNQRLALDINAFKLMVDRLVAENGQLRQMHSLSRSSTPHHSHHSPTPTGLLPHMYGVNISPEKSTINSSPTPPPLPVKQRRVLQPNTQQRLQKLSMVGGEVQLPVGDNGSPSGTPAKPGIKITMSPTGQLRGVPATQTSPENIAILHQQQQQNRKASEEQLSAQPGKVGVQGPMTKIGQFAGHANQPGLAGDANPGHPKLTRAAPANGVVLPGGIPGAASSFAAAQQQAARRVFAAFPKQKDSASPPLTGRKVATNLSQYENPDIISATMRTFPSPANNPLVVSSQKSPKLQIKVHMSSAGSNQTDASGKQSNSGLVLKIDKVVMDSPSSTNSTPINAQQAPTLGSFSLPLNRHSVDGAGGFLSGSVTPGTPNEDVFMDAATPTTSGPPGFSRSPERSVIPPEVPPKKKHSKSSLSSQAECIRGRSASTSHLQGKKISRPSSSGDVLAMANLQLNRSVDVLTPCRERTSCLAEAANDAAGASRGPASSPYPRLSSQSEPDLLNPSDSVSKSEAASGSAQKRSNASSSPSLLDPSADSDKSSAPVTKQNGDVGATKVKPDVRPAEKVSSDHSKAPVNERVNGHGSPLMRQCQPSTQLPDDTAVAQCASNIAKGINSLLMCAQKEEFEKFVPCALFIANAVSEMAVLFPLSDSSKSLHTSLTKLLMSTSRLKEDCVNLRKIVNQHRQQGFGDAEFQQFKERTQRIIQHGWDVAQASKTLVERTDRVRLNRA